jgi:hypothetical protein
MDNLLVRTGSAKELRVLSGWFDVDASPSSLIKALTHRIENRILSAYIDVEAVNDILQRPPQ